MAELSMSVVIPCWNGESQLRANLPSVLEAARRAHAEIILIDDHSTLDQTAAYLTTLAKAETWIRVYTNAQNLGFARSVNRGVSLAKGELVVLLNTDVAPAPDCLVRLRAYFRDPDVFAVTCNSGEGYAGATWQHGFLHHFPIASITSAPSLWASGGQAAFAKAKWQELSGMDPLYAPFYWEDVDLGYRAWKRGWRILFAPDAHCTHRHETSVIHTHYQSQVASVALRNQLLFVWKNIADRAYLWDHVRRLPGFALRHPRAFFAALVRLPTVIRVRAKMRGMMRKQDHEIVSMWSAPC